MTELFERDAELHSIGQALSSAVGGAGRVLLIEGPLGIGKTSLLSAAAERAGRLGLATLSARGDEFETGFPYGFVRQLLDPVLRVADAATQKRWFGGAAALSAPALSGPVDPDTDRSPDLSSVMHGLYWLVANMSDAAPVALFVDDAHLADGPSLRFLLYLARRLQDLRVTMIASVRTVDGTSDRQLVTELKAESAGRVLSPAPLSDEAVAVVLAKELGAAPDEAFVRASMRVTGGVPLYVRELARALRADGTEPDSTAVPRIASVGPQALAKLTLTRLARTSPDAVKLAQAVAVLGGDARLPRAAALAEMDALAAIDAIDVLVGAEVFPPSGQLEFCHPIVREAIYQDLPIGARSLAHRRAADMLSAEGAELDAVAGHLLLCRPTGSAQSIESLRAAANRARALGAPDTAATYLTRALEECPGRELRTDLLLELGRAEGNTGSVQALDHFAEAERIAPDRVARATAMMERARLTAFGDAASAVALLERARTELSDGPDELRNRAEMALAVMCTLDPRMVDTFRAARPEMRRLVDSGQSGTRPLAFVLALWGATTGDDPQAVRDLVEEGWDGGRYLAEPITSDVFAPGVGALVLVDHLERAREMLAAIRQVAQNTGSVVHDMVVSAMEAFVCSREGDLATAAAEMRSGAERAVELGLPLLAAVTLWCGSDVLLERPDVADLAALAESIDPTPFATLHPGAQFVEVRGRLRFAAGDREGGIADLRRAVEIAEAFGPSAPGWGSSPRSALALMLGPAERDEARALARADLAAARTSGRSRQIGVALRAVGLLETDRREAEAHLVEAADVLSASPATLEHARALVELGAFRRRNGDRMAARELLLQGFDMANRCGAVNLAERAHGELLSSGARPRRGYLSGRMALSPGELRVARLAAQGQSSRDIAQALFVTTKTIDAHLNRTYSKLGINSRKQLAAALAE